MADRDDEPADAGPTQTIAAHDVTRLATDYLARYAAASRHLRRVLARQIRRWHERRSLAPPDDAAVASLIDDTLARLAGLGLLDDEAFAVARARRLVAKGLPGEQIRRRLAADGLDPRGGGLDQVIVADTAAQARRYAARKRLGPFRVGARAPFRDKDVRRLVRAGFSFREAVAVVDGAADAPEDEPTG